MHVASHTSDLPTYVFNVFEHEHTVCIMHTE